MIEDEKTNLTDALNCHNVTIDKAIAESPNFSLNLLAQNKNIKRLTITYFTNETLDLSFITSLPNLNTLLIFPNKKQLRKLKTIVFPVQPIPSLKHIAIVGNKSITRIPKNIRFATNLQILKLEHNRLSGNMDELEGLPLTRLSLNSNQFTEFNHRLFHNPHLQHLFLSDNHITHIDTADMNTKDIPLKTFFIYKNKLNTFNFTLANSSLHTLCLNKNQLNHVPHCLADMKSLAWLSISNNPDIKELPNWFVQLPLRDVSLSGLTHINWQSLTTLKHISYLDMAACDLTQIPDVIFTLQALKGINLNYNFIQHIPQEIAQLTKLEYIYIGSNELTQIPTALLACKKLSSVYLEMNNFSKQRYEKTVKLLKQAGIECETDI